MREELQELVDTVHEVRKSFTRTPTLGRLTITRNEAAGSTRYEQEATLGLETYRAQVEISARDLETQPPGLREAAMAQIKAKLAASLGVKVGSLMASSLGAPIPAMFATSSPFADPPRRRRRPRLDWSAPTLTPICNCTGIFRTCGADNP